MEIGLIGKPSSGKSSFFKAATMIDVPIDSRPFTTIKPNIGIGYVTVSCVEKEFNTKCKPNHGKCEDGIRYIPIKIWDVAGIVPGAHLGKGLGLKFLDDIRQASVLIHIIDTSGKTDSEGNPTSNHDPVEDVRFVENEIDEWFKGIISKAIDKYNQKSKTGKIDIIDVLEEQLSGLQIKRQKIEEVFNETGLEDVVKFSKTLRKASKPIIIAANKIDLENSEKNFERLKNNFGHLKIIPTSAAAEIALRTANEKGLIKYSGDEFSVNFALEKKQMDGLNFIKENVLKKYGSTGIQKCLNEAIFNTLGCIIVYPVANSSKLTDSKGNVLPDAYIVKKGTTIKQFAFMIHTDLGERFIGGIDARTGRKLGQDYELKNNDVIEILFKK